MIPRRAFSYTRFSTAEQLKGDSLRRQTSLAQAYCERNGLLLDTSLVLQDLGVSAFRGANAKRGALAGFFNAIEDGQVLPGDVLIVENLDRLSRENPLTAVDLLRSIVDRGVSVVTLAPEMVLSKETINSLAVLLPVVVQASLANSESVKKSERIGEAWADKRSRLQSEKFTAKGPFWLKLRPNRTGFDPIPEQVKVVRRIFEDCRDGHGIIGIVKRLNDDGIPTPRRKGIWATATVSSILKSRAVLGELTPRSRGKVVGPPIQNYYPAILTEEEFDAANAAMQSRKNTNRGRIGKGIANLFTGKLRDARDRSSIYVVIKPKFKPEDRQRIQSEAARRRKTDGPYKSIPMRFIEGAFAAILDAIDHWAEKPSTRAEIEATEQKLKALAEKVRTVQGQIAEDEDGTLLLPVLQKLGKQQKELTQRLASLKEEEAGQRKADLDVAHDLAGRLYEGEEVRRRLKAKIGLLVEEMWIVVFDTVPKQRVAELQVFFKNGTQASAYFGPRGRYAVRDACFTSVGPIPAKWDLRKYKGWYDGTEEQNMKAAERRMDQGFGGKSLLHTSSPMEIEGEAADVHP